VDRSGARVHGQSVGRRLSISLGKHTTVFQADVHVYAKLASVQETETQDRPEKYVSVCADSQAALKALQAAKTTSPLVRQCQKALNDISNRHTAGLYWVPGHVGLRGNKIADKLARDGYVQQFVGLEHFLGVSRQNIRRKIKRWMDNQHIQARELISGPNLAKRARLLSFNKTPSRSVIGLLTGHNTLRGHLYVMGLSNNAVCRKCGTEEETSVHILCEGEALASLRHSYVSRLLSF
jgi:hypothetical protein